MSTQPPQLIYSKIWKEEAEPDNRFATKTAYCRGFNVYGEMLGQVRWVEMIYLLFQENPPAPQQCDVLETLAVALANPGPRDHSVHAAMCGGVSGSTAASCLMAALAVGGGQLAGGREVFLAMEGWQKCGTDLAAWQKWFEAPMSEASDIWAVPEHPPGFDLHGTSTTTIVRQTLQCLASLSPESSFISWLNTHHTDMETMVGYPLTLSGICAATLSDLHFTPEQGEMIHLLLRLPGAAAHALEQRQYGYKKFPFGQIELDTENDAHQTT